MVTRFKKVLKNQKGLTLIELLAVVVILGIISAIAVPSIGGIIDNTKKDAHVANAKQMISAAKLAITGESDLQPKGNEEVYLSLKYLIDEGYLEPLEDPDKTDGGYDVGTYDSNTTGKSEDPSVVKVTKDGNNFKFEVKISNGERGITDFKEASALDRKLFD